MVAPPVHEGGWSMVETNQKNVRRSVLVIGASRGLGEAIVEEYARRGARVTATVRGDVETPLHRFAASTDAAVEIERVDIADRGDVDALARRLGGRTYDL